MHFETSFGYLYSHKQILFRHPNKVVEKREAQDLLLIRY